MLGAGTVNFLENNNIFTLIFKRGLHSYAKPLDPTSQNTKYNDVFKQQWSLFKGGRE